MACNLFYLTLPFYDKMSDWEDDMYDDDENDEELSFDDDDNDDDDNDDDNIVIDNDIHCKKPKILDIESLYFQSKNLKEDENYIESIKLFETIVNDNSNISYQFKSIKQLIKIYELNEDNIDKIIILIDKLFEIFINNTNSIDLSYFKSSLSKIINRIERLNTRDSFDLQIFQKLFDNLQNFNDTTYNKLLIKLQLSISNNLINLNNLNEASIILNNLQSQIIDNHDPFFINIIAFKISILIEKLRLSSDDYKILGELKKYCKLANNLISGIPQSKILGIINDGSGIISLYSHDYLNANIYFQNSFKNFNDFGDIKRIDLLIKFIITSILINNEINPFQSNDFKGFIKNDKINLLLEIYKSYQEVNLKKFNYLINNELVELDLLKDYKIIEKFIPIIQMNLQLNYLSNRIKLFEKVKFDYFMNRMEINDYQYFKKLLLKLYSKGELTNYKINFKHNYIIKRDLHTFINIKPIQYIDNYFRLKECINENCHEEFVQNLKSIKEKKIDNENDKTFDEQSQLQTDNNYFTNINMNMNILNTGQTFSSDKPINEIDIDNIKLECMYSSNTLQNLLNNLYEDKTLKRDLPNHLNIRPTLISYIEEYLRILNNSIPIVDKNDNNNDNKSYINKVNDTRANIELSMLYKDKDKESSSLSSNNYEKDDNLPDIIQHTNMNQLETPHNNDVKLDEDVQLNTKSQKLLQLQLIRDNIASIGSKGDEMMFNV